MEETFRYLRNCVLVSLLSLLLVPTMSRAQDPEKRSAISGKITDENGKPLEGAVVLVKGTQDRTTTKADGSFSIVAKRNAVLVVSSVGYADKEVAVDPRAVMNISLNAVTSALDDVVVVGYGTRKKADVTGAIASINSKQIEQVPTTNLVQALQGRLPGVVINTTNFRPGEAPFIRIRGNRTFAANAGTSSQDNPVVVVDGIITPYSLSDFNPLDIESVDVLKDASATAIYGARGANGVILVTTKKGKAGKLSIDVHSYVSFDSPLRQLDVMNGGEFAELRRVANRNSSATFSKFPTPASDLTIFPEYYTQQAVLAGYQWRNRAALIPQMRVTTTDEKALYGVDSIPVYDPNNVRTTDWQTLGSQPGLTQNYQIRVSGGTDKVRSSFSGAYYTQKGLQMVSDYTRYSAALSTDFKPNKTFSFGGSINASSIIQNYGPEIYGNASNQLPIAQPYDSTGQFIYLPGGDINIQNPLRDPSNVFDERRISRIFGSFYAELQPVNGLRLRVNFGPDISNTRRGTFNGSLSSSKQGNTPADAAYNYQNYFNWVLENLVFYDTKIKDHNIGITLLQSFQKERTEGSAVSARNLIYESQLWYGLQNNTDAAALAYSSNFSQTQLQSYMGRLNYSYKNRYLLTASGRWDGASQLAVGHKWTFFPSAAVAWKMEQEDFMKNIRFVNQLKLRVGVGSVGSPGVSAYSVTGPLTQRPYAWDETALFGYSPGNPAPQVSWPVTTTTNVGLDFSLFNSRLNGSIELYRQDTRDQVQARAIPSTSGFTSSLYNVGLVRNSGIELSLSSVNIQNKKPGGFRWTTDIVFTKNKEQILDIDGTKTDNVGNRWFIGQPIAVFYDYKFDGIFQNNAADLAYINALKTKTPSLGTGLNALSPGIIKVRDTNGDSLLNANDYQILGSPNPKWTSGINNTFSWKGFDLSVYAYISWGGMLNSIRTRVSMGGRYQQLDVPYWTPQNQSNEYPKPVLNNDIPLFGAALQYQDASFVRIRSISLQYTVPVNIVQRYLKANSLSFYVNAVNPFLFSKFKVLDPEVVNAGTTSTTGTSVFFSTKSYVVGIKLGI